MPYRNDEVWTFGGPLRVMAVVWSWNDDQHDKFHRNLVCPHLDHMVAVMGRWFAHVEVVHYPPLQPGWGGRRALLCREKRTLADAGHYPAIDIEQSISRAMTNLIEPAHLDLVRRFQAAHMAKGWVDIGYNTLVCPHGRVIEGGEGRLGAAHGREPPLDAGVAGVQQPERAVEQRALRPVEPRGHRPGGVLGHGAVRRRPEQREVCTLHRSP